MKNTKEAISSKPSETEKCMNSQTYCQFALVCTGLGLMSFRAERRGLKPTSIKQNVCPIAISIF